MVLVEGQEYAIMVAGYSFPDYGRLVGRRYRADGEVEYLFESTRGAYGRRYAFGLTEAEIRSAVNTDPFEGSRED